MSSPAELEAVEAVLADEDNKYLSAEQVAEKVLGALAVLRRRPWRYLTIAQDRSRDAGSGLREFCPTWARGPFQTLSEARQRAIRERRESGPDVKVMTVRVFGPDDEVDPDSLKEVRA